MRERSNLPPRIRIPRRSWLRSEPSRKTTFCIWVNCPSFKPYGVASTKIKFTNYKLMTDPKKILK